MRPRTLPLPLALGAALALAACDTLPEPLPRTLDDAMPAALQAKPPEDVGLWHDAAAGVDDEELAMLSETWWQWRLANDPVHATYLGDPRYHGEWPRNSARARDAKLDELRDLDRRASRLDPAALSARDRTTLEMLRTELANRVTMLEHDLEAWTVDPLFGPHVVLLDLTEVQPVQTARQRRQLVERWRGFAPYLRVAASNLRRAANEGTIASDTAFRKQLDQLDALLATDPMDSPLVRIATGGGRWVPLPPDGNVARVAHEELGDARLQRELRKVNLHLQEGDRLSVGTRVLLPAQGDPLSPEERGRFLNDVLTAVERDVYPALASYRDTLLELRRRGRPDDRPGLVHVRGGERAYRDLVALHTSLPADELDPRRIHELGIAEMDRIRAEMSALGRGALGTGELRHVQAKLRSDPSMRFATRAEVEEAATAALERARRAVPRRFGRLPRARCVVRPVPSHSERDTTTAYYQPPEPGGGRPGVYYVNTYRPETRPRYEAEVLAFHEAVPGHHTQIALAQELGDLPLFRRHGGQTAFVEGWALYAERLCDEMGLYSSDLQRLGMLSYDAWRASRLVVDTGLHALGWSREQAIDYLLANTLLSPENVENEVDRYIAWPGQALAYKLGQREILALRAEAEEALGASFTLADFHDRVLGEGAVTLPVLRRQVRAWIGRGGGTGPREASAGRPAGGDAPDAR